MHMNYVMSDIHGEQDRYDRMLKEIHFSLDDTLYVIGDVMDRFPFGVNILRDIMARPNVQLILGNHELMCLTTFEKQNDVSAKQHWMRNGGEPTYNDLISLPSEERKAILSYLSKLPDHLDIHVNKRKFHLVHGFPGKNTHDRIWHRPSRTDRNPFLNKRTVIIGHTPVFDLNDNAFFDIFRCLKGAADNHYKIKHTKEFIDIDCGCGNDMSARRLACLRLEDMAEFYT